MITYNFKIKEDKVKGVDTPRSTDDIKAVDVIYETTNLDHFRPNPMNRDINETEVRSILKGIRKGNYVCLQVIEVFEPDEDGIYVIAEGNTRYEAIKRAKAEGITVPIKFRIVRDKDLESSNVTRNEYVHIINNERKDWGLADMVDFYIRDDSNPERQETYRRLKDFCSEHCRNSKGGINYRYGAAILSMGDYTSTGIRDGLLKIKTSNDTATRNKEIIDMTAENAGVKLKNNFIESFIKAFFQFRSDPEYGSRLLDIGYDGFFNRLAEHAPYIPLASNEYWFDIFREHVK